MNTDELRAGVTGSVFTPADDGYAVAAATWDMSAGSRPPLVLQAATASDIVAGARFAADNGLLIAVRGTGHGARSDDGQALVISTARLRGVSVDAGARRATVQPGARWSDVSAKSAPSGMLPLEGGSSTVGVTGYTLGGGLSPIGRTFGFAADRVRRLTVLDADYRPRVVDDTDSDAFWALRGAGGIAIVTEIEFDLVSVPSLFGGGVYFRGEDAETVLNAYSEWLEGLDARTSTSVALVRLPPIPQLPDNLRGAFVAHLRIAHVDEASPDIAADGRRIVAPMLATGRVISDYTRRLTPSELPDIHRDPVAPLAAAYQGALIDELDKATIARMSAVIGHGVAGEPTLVEVRHLGGAYARQPSSPDCVTGRNSQFNIYVSGPYDADDPGASRAHVDRAATHVTTSQMAQLNFAGPASAPGQVLKLWSEHDAGRILAVQKTFDPDNRISTGRPLR